MALELTNTLGGRRETFEPRQPGRVGMYTCGPTVYGPAHIGNFRTFVFSDLLRRYLGWLGYEVTWVMNITDVDDRIIRDLREKGTTIERLTAPYVERFQRDLATLRITTPDVMPRATAHVAEMAELTGVLLAKEHAYRTDDGSIFFRISSWPKYGQLARLDPEQLRATGRVEADDYGKDDIRDFALWKGPREGEPSWSTPIGEGRPGWHIECSAMSMRYLGPSFDLHTGGVDLIFPHHEDETAQSEAATGQRFVRTWLHSAHLQLGGERMARREGNISRVDDVLGEGWSARALRYALLATHYRSPIEYSDALLGNATAAVERLSTVLAALDAYDEDRPDDPELPVVLEDARTAFRQGLDDDLNISKALGATFELVRELNSRLDDRAFSTADARRAAASIRDLDTVLAVAEEEEIPLDEDLQRLLAERVAAREARDWGTSDRLRDELAARGLLVEDTRDGQRWRRVGTGGSAEAGPTDG